MMTRRLPDGHGRRPDQILVVEEGCIAGHGAHDERIGLGGRYAAFGPSGTAPATGG
jgi:hypothetical protein